MFFYLTVVAQASEITIKCRAVALKFDNLEFSNLLAFFEMEVFAFGGILFGLWLWLTLKFLTNFLF